MISKTDSGLLDKVFFLVANLPGSETLRNNIMEVFEETGDWSQVSTLVDDYMNQLITQDEVGINGVAKSLFENGMNLRFSIPEIEQIIANFLREGIDSWPTKVFVYFITPQLISSTPADNTEGVALASDIVLTFNENVKAGAGNIEISDGNNDVRLIDVSSDQVVFNGDIVTINPTNDLELSKIYSVQMASGVITDSEGSPYLGISDTTTLNFATTFTGPPPPPSLAFDKQVIGVDIAGDGFLNAAGDVIDYRLVVTNIGNQTLTNVVVIDTLTGLSETIASMAPGGSQDIATSYTLTQADLDSNGTVEDAIAGSIGNTATADSDQTDLAVGSEQVPLEVFPSLALDKQFIGIDDGEGDGILNAAGEVIDYRLVVTNAGNQTLTNVVVIDTLTGLSETIASMAPGGVRNIATSYTLTQADIDSNGTMQDAIAGFIDNTATANSDQTGPVVDSEQVPLTFDLLLFDKQVVGVDILGDGILNAAGDVIDYRLVVTNAGSQTLTNVVVTDPLTGFNAAVTTLEVDEVRSVLTSYALTQADIDSNGTIQDAIAGFIDNTATADSDQTDPVVDSEQVPLILPLLALDKQFIGINDGEGGDGILNAAGEVINYNLVVTNDGNQTLTNIVVSDPLTGLSETIASMTPGGVRNIATSYRLTQADIDSNGTMQDAIAGFIDNTATANSDQTGPVVDSEQVPLTFDLLLFDKQVVGVDILGDRILNAAGDVIDYSLVVTNAGSQTLTNVVVSDPLTGLSETIASMAPGGVRNIATSYTLTQADINSNGTVEDNHAGFIDNTATADSDQTAPIIDSEQVPLIPLIFTLTTDVTESGVQEGDFATFTVTASGAVAIDTDVVFSIVPGDQAAADQGTTDTNLNDFFETVFNPRTLVIPAGSTSVSLGVAGLDDGLTELPETYSVEATVAGQTVNLSVSLVDSPPSLPIFTLTSDVTEAGVQEGNAATFTVTASEAVATDTNVVFSVVPGDPTAANQGTGFTNLNDFVAGMLNPVTVTILAGETTGTFSVVGEIDGITELAETFSVDASVAGQTLTRSISLIDAIDISPIVSPNQVFTNLEAVLDDLEGFVGPINEITDIVGTVEANDDIGVTSFSILPGDFSGFFTIDSVGNLRLTTDGLIAATNDFELNPNEFLLNIIATDGVGNESAPELVTINVTDNPDDNGRTFDLTHSADMITGSFGNDQILGPIIADGTSGETFSGDTLQSSDVIDGSAGLDNLAFDIGAGDGLFNGVPTNTDTFGNILINPTVSNVEVFDITSFGNGNVLDMSRIGGVTTVNILFNDNSFSLRNVDNIIDLGLINSKDNNTNSVLTVNYTDSVLTSENDVMTLILDGASDRAVINNSGTINTLETLIINSVGSSNSIDLSGVALTITNTLIITGDANLNLTSSGFGFGFVGAIRPDVTVNASGATGDLVLNLFDVGNEMVVIGGAGDDTIISGEGKNTLTGGSGSDTFSFAAGDSGVTLEEIDIVTDFSSGVDILNFNGLAGANNFVNLGVNTAANYDALLARADTELVQGSGRYVFASNGVDGWVFADNILDAINGSANLSIQLNGVTEIVSADIV